MGSRQFVPLGVHPRRAEYAPPSSNITELHVPVENDILIHQLPNRFEIIRQVHQTCNNNETNVKREEKTSSDHRANRKEENLRNSRAK